MNRLFKKGAISRFGKNGIKSLIISIVILVEVLAIFAVATFAWVETVSSIKIKTDAGKPLVVDSYYFTEADIGGTHGTIDLGKYFKPSGDMHFAPCSSADGDSFYFPKKSGATAFLGAGSGNFRKGTSSDKNTAYMSVTFKLRANTNADFFFYFNGNDNPTFSNQAENMRVSVTAYTEGTSKGDLYDNTGKPKYTTVYANTASTAAVVGNTSGATTATAVEAFSAHKKGSGSSNRLFSVGASETKIVTINVWLQGTTSSSNLASNIAISNFGIISDLTPRHVTLLPTPTWDSDSATFYAWCWTPNSGKKSRLYKLELDSEEEHYTFDYNGTYTKTTFVRAVPGCTVQSGEYDSWPFTRSTSSSDHDNNKYWNQTVNTSIPNEPVDPTYIKETISGGTDSKSTGSWHDPATIHVAYAPDQSSTWGTMELTSYVGSNTSSHVIETTNSSSTKHTDTVHAWPGKCIKLEATAKTNYRFEGWYTDAECNTPAPTVGSTPYTSATYTTTAPSTATEITYYAKFVETRTLTIYRYLDGSSSGTACGTITIKETGSTSGAETSTSGTSVSKTFDKGTSVTFSAVAASGYSLSGIYTTSDGNTTATSPLTLNNDTQYYARFTTNSYNVITHACYSTNGGTTYTVDNGTGGTVQTGDSDAGATSTASVKYKSDVTLTASANANYVFVGWFTAATGGSEVTLTNNKYTLNTVGTVDIYARFIKEQWEIKHGVSGQSGWTSESMTVSNGVATGTLSLTSGDEYSFQITKTVGSDTTWYGNSNISSVDILTDTVLNAVSLSENGGDMFIKAGRTGTYSFSYNISTGKLTVSTSATKPTVKIWHGAFDDDTGGYWSMTPTNNSNLYTYTTDSTTDFTEGQKIYFKINDQTRTKWYSNRNGTDAGYYSGYTTTPITNYVTLGDDESTGNMYIHAHAGRYKFTFDYSTKKLKIEVTSWSDITITVDYDGQSWFGGYGAKIYFYADSSDQLMTDATTTTKTITVKSNVGNGTNVGFNRKSSSGGQWNNWNAGSRGFKTTYKITGGDNQASGTGYWD